MIRPRPEIILSPVKLSPAKSPSDLGCSLRDEVQIVVPVPPDAAGMLDPFSSLSPRTRRRWNRALRPRGEDGGVTLEGVVAVTLLLVFTGVLVVMGQLLVAKGHVTDAARNGAEAAVIASTSAQAQAQAGGAAAATLAPAHCQTMKVSADTSNFGPGGSVMVSVSCNVALDTLGVPGSVTVTRSARAPMESYRNA